MSLLQIPPDVSVLNCGAGDMTFSFDPNDALECARAERVIKDMLKRGYMLFAKVDGKYVRVKEFDEKRHEYVIADGPEASPQPDDEFATGPDPKPSPKVAKETKQAKGRGRRRVPARGTPVTGVAPTAGG